MFGRWRKLLALVLLVAGLGSPILGLLWLSPALLLGAVLLLGFYPGERVVLEVAARGERRYRARRPRSPRKVAPAGGRFRAPRALVPRGSTLLAFHRGVRPPPVVSLG